MSLLTKRKIAAIFQRAYIYMPDVHQLDQFSPEVCRSVFLDERIVLDFDDPIQLLVRVAELFPAGQTGAQQWKVLSADIEDRVAALLDAAAKCTANGSRATKIVTRDTLQAVVGLGWDKVSCQLP